MPALRRELVAVQRKLAILHYQRNEVLREQLAYLGCARGEWKLAWGAKLEEIGQKFIELEALEVQLLLLRR